MSVVPIGFRSVRSKCPCVFTAESSGMWQLFQMCLLSKCINDPNQDTAKWKDMLVVIHAEW